MKDYSLYRAYAKVDLGAIKNNLISVRSALSGTSNIIGVVKADAYGHGAAKVACAVREHVGAFAVATPEEALELREIINDKPIYVLGYSHPDAYADLIEKDIVIAIFRYSDALLLSDCAKKLKKKAKVNIKIDTGMGRIGFTAKEALGETLKISKLPEILICASFMHFSVSDSKLKEDIDFTKEQQSKFTNYIKGCEENSLTFSHVSSASSAACIEMPFTHATDVRVGILMYGYYPSKSVSRDKVKVTPALSLHSHAVQVKEIEAGDSVGYGRTFVAKEKMRVATIPLGYGDGYPRLLSNKGRVLIRGKFAPIIGRICMDMFMVDVSAIPEAEYGDEVVLIGRQGENTIDADELASLTDTISYEILCDIGKRVPRIYIQ